MQKLPNEKESDLQIQINKIIQSLFTYSFDIGLNNLVGTFHNFIGFKGKDEKSKIIFHKKIISNYSSSNINKIKHEKYQIFNKLYTKDNKDKLIYNFGKIIFISYKINFPVITNIKGKKYTSDSGWGCMIRCGQMIMARGLYKYFKKIGFSTKYSLIHSVEFFMENPFPFDKMPDNFINMMNYFLSIWYKENNNNISIKTVYAPFSIKSLCTVGRIVNKDVGVWFSDFNMVYMFSLINDNYHLFKNLKIFNFQSQINFKQVLNECFSKENSLFQEDDFIEIKNEKYYFKKIGIIYVSIRLGIKSISKEYYKSLKELFLCKNCLGLIGGRERLAYYFIGYDNKGNLLYLDPHTTNESQIKFDENVLIQNYLIKNIYSIPINKVTSAFTIGFYFRNGKEFMELVNFLENYVKQEFPCFILSEHDNDKINIDNNELMNDIDDF
jgi:hypothetical protein